MCGISGFIGKTDINQGVIDRTLKIMKNRGILKTEKLEKHIKTNENTVFVCRLRFFKGPQQ